LVFERMYHAGVRNTKQLATAAGISRRSVYTYKAKLLRGEPLEPPPQRRPARKFTAPIRRCLAQLVAQNPEISGKNLAVELSQRYGGSFSGRGVLKVLKSMGDIRSAFNDQGN